MTYYCYILECKDKKKYTGQTNDLTRRLREHAQGQVKSTQNRRPVKLVYFETFSSRSEAFKKEQ